jgi:CDP-diglyceride synthetase
MPPAAAPAGNDKTTLWGVLGIVVGLLCCGLLGIVFGVLSMNEAKKAGKPKTLGIIAIVLSVLNIIGSIIYSVTMRK